MTAAKANSYAYKLRIILRTHPDGMSVKELCGLVGLKRASVIYAALNKRMPDAYIDRWEPVLNKHGRKMAPRQIWCVVEVPENCPRPGK